MLAKVKYLGDLRTESLHLQSGEKLITDAPIDNHGKGEAFSPTDLVTNATASCMLTIMGIKAEDMGVDISGSTAEVFKEMIAAPRRIGKITVHFKMQGVSETKHKQILERAALTCPVYLSLHEAIVKEVTFEWH